MWQMVELTLISYSSGSGYSDGEGPSPSHVLAPCPEMVSPVITKQ